MRERFEQRLFRIFAQAGYSPVQLLTITPEEMVEIPGITVPNIRAVLCVQNKVLADRNKVRSGRLVEELLKDCGGRPFWTCAGWMRTATRCPNGEIRCATLPGMNGILPV